MADEGKLKPVVVDVDGVVYGFTSLSAYQTLIPFDIQVSGPSAPRLNHKMLNGFFGSGRKSKF